MYLNWLPGKKNFADAASKLPTNSVKLLNIEQYIHGPEELMNIDGVTHVAYYKHYKSSSLFS